MKDNNKKFILDKDMKSTKNSLKNLGEKFRDDAKDSQSESQSLLNEMYDKTPENKKNKFKAFFKKPLVYLPVAGMAVLVLAFIALRSIYYVPSYIGESYSKSTPLYLDEDTLFGVTPFSDTAGAGYSSGTFKDKFLNTLGRHEASPDDIAEKGSILEKDLNIDIITTEKEDDVERFAKDIFESLDGYVENINQRNYRYSKRLMIYGKIPAEKVDELRDKLKD